jgi:DNA-binding MarR family transcriptional regulator
MVVLLASVYGKPLLKAPSSRKAGRTDPLLDAPPSPPDSHDLLQLLEQLNDIATAIEHDLQQQFDSSLAEFEVLEALRKKPLPQSHLCRRNHRSAPVISRCVKRLTDQGYAASHPPRHDRRERVASLTKRGLNQHQRIRAHLAGLLFQLAQELTPTLEGRLLGLHQKFSHIATRPSGAKMREATD